MRQKNLLRHPWLGLLLLGLACAALPSPARAAGGPAAKPVIHLSGGYKSNGGKGPLETRTHAFQVPASWTIHWSYNCSNSAHLHRAPFLVKVLHPGSSVPDDVFVQLAAAGHGVQTELRRGRFYLDIQSPCGSWHISVFP